jgi:hypothetical protein
MKKKRAKRAEYVKGERGVPFLFLFNRVEKRAPQKPETISSEAAVGPSEFSRSSLSRGKVFAAKNEQKSLKFSHV